MIKVSVLLREEDSVFVVSDGVVPPVFVLMLIYRDMGLLMFSLALSR